MAGGRARDVFVPQLQRGKCGIIGGLDALTREKRKIRERERLL